MYPFLSLAICVYADLILATSWPPCSVPGAPQVTTIRHMYHDDYTKMFCSEFVTGTLKAAGT